jgi:hypothetical protein
MAFAAVREVTQAAKEDAVMDNSTDVGKLQSAAVRRNAVAMANLTMGFTSEATMILVHKAMTAEWPTGLAHLAVAAMFKKSRPQDAVTRVELRKVLNDIKMKKGKDPATLFEQISSIENKCNAATKKINEDDLIAEGGSHAGPRNDLVDCEFPSEGAKVAFGTSIADKEQSEWFAALEQLFESVGLVLRVWVCEQGGLPVRKAIDHFEEVFGSRRSRRCVGIGSQHRKQDGSGDGGGGRALDCNRNGIVWQRGNDNGLAREFVGVSSARHLSTAKE